MSPERLAHRIFSDLIDQPAHARPRLLREADVTDEVRAEVLALLDALDSRPEFLEDGCHDELLSAATLLERLAGPSGLPELEPGTALDDFEIVTEVGRGALACVYLAKQNSLGRNVALKVSLGDVGEEARIMARLDHDHIAKVYGETSCDHGPRGRLRLLAMQLVPGVPLDRILARLRRTPELDFLAALDQLWQESPQADHLMMDLKSLKDRQTFANLATEEIITYLGTRLADALAFAHEHGVLHLDIKPSNILITVTGRPYLVDFNVSLRQADLDDGRRSLLGGTLDFMAPEQSARMMKGNTVAIVDRRADIYALGRVLEEILKCIGGGEARSHRHLQTIIATCLRAHPEERYADASALSRALAHAGELKSIMESIPRRGPISALAERYPMWSMFAFGMIPQLIGSVFNIGYNYSLVIRRLAPEQIAQFEHLVVAYNAIFYPLPLALFLYWTRRIYRDLPAVLRGHQVSDDGLRQMVLNIPRYVVALTTCGWGPGLVFFPWGLWLLSGGAIDAGTMVHLAIPILVSWILAVSYSCLGLHFWSLRVIYPKLLPVDRPVREVARTEVKPLGRGSQIFQMAAGATPLFAALTLIVAQGLSGEPGGGFHDFVLIFLILIGLIGFALAMIGTQQVTHLLTALTGNQTTREPSRIRTV